MRVFVYGTLTDPERVAAVLEAESQPPAQYSFVGPATLEGLHHVDGAYPTLAPGGRVEGRVLAVDDRGLERLDQYEGVDTGLYVRVSIPTTEAAAGVGARTEAVADEPIAVYVGDPTRLGVAERVDWPAGESFAERVRTYVDRAAVSVSRSE